MTIAIGIYDLFAYTVPGVLYLYIINECLKSLGYGYIDINQVSSLAHILLITVAAFVTAQLLDFPARLYCYRLLYRKKNSEQALEHLKRRYKVKNLQFRNEDWNLILMVIRQNHMDLSQFIDRYEASSIMARNLCFGFSLFALFQLVMYATHASRLIYLAGFLLCAVLAFLAIRVSIMYHSWFFQAIFLYGSTHGKNLNEVLHQQAAIDRGSTNNQSSEVERKS